MAGISYKKNENGVEYGTASVSKRVGNQVVKDSEVYLGRVVDKEAKIFKHRSKGYIKYNTETGEIEQMPADYREPETKKVSKPNARKSQMISFGDTFFLDSYIRKIGFDKVVDAIGFENRDSLYALLSYYILSDLSNFYANDWWGLTYAKYLYPGAKLESQRISELLADLGSEDVKRRFFAEYNEFISRTTADVKMPYGIDDAILIDSIGLPNAVHMPITAGSDHNGGVKRRDTIHLCDTAEVGHAALL